MRRKILNILIAFLCPIAFADTPPTILLGHNFSSTGATLKKGQVTLGNYATAIGVTDWLTLGTSPWMILNYNMPMISFRTGASLGDRMHFGFDVNYFHTVKMLMNLYDQNSIYVRATISRKHSETYTDHLNFSYQGYFEGERLYSLRLYGDRDKYNLTVSSLHEIHLSKSFGTFLEFGISGINYLVSYGLLGASIFWNFSPLWSLQLGASYTFATHDIGFLGENPHFSKAIHPEIQLQYFL